MSRILSLPFTTNHYLMRESKHLVVSSNDRVTYYLITLFLHFVQLQSLTRSTLVRKFYSMGWGSIYVRRMKVFSLALLIYLDYKSLKHREKRMTESEKLALWEKAHERNANRIVKLIIQMEGMWVKMGQYFSVRADGLPGAYPRLLKQLQDSLPPRCLKEVRRTIESELGKPMEDLFTNFVEAPLATASIAQVHRATLRDGQEVVVKVQHEGIKTIIMEDLKDAKSVVEWIVWAEPKFNFNPVINEWCKEAPKELDFNQEAENTRKVYHNLGCKEKCPDKKPKHRVKVLMPEVIQSTERVLILEYMDGVRLNDSRSLESLGVNKKNIVEEITRAYAHQIFVDGFFNADPHPGNFLVTKSHPHYPILLDFGFTKLLSSSMKHTVAKMFLASAELDALSGDIILFLRVLNLLAGLSSALNVSVSYYRIIRPFAESALESDLNERPKDNAEWVCDSPVNSELEAKLRPLLVKLGNADKILGIQVCAYKDGKVIIDTAAGVLGNYDPSPVKPDTLFPVFSVTKGVTAGILHWLVDKGKVKLDENVANIWPEFSSNRKDLIKVHHVLNHTSGLQNALAHHVQDNPMVLCDWDECLKRIAMAAPETEPGKEQVYHYLSYGWLCGGIIEHASKNKFQDILKEALVVGCVTGLNCIFMLASGVESRLATLTLDTNDINKLTDVNSPTSVSSSTSQSMFNFDVLSGLVPLFNTLNVRRAILPAANGHCSARALARYYATLVDGGVVPPPHSSISQPPLGSHPHHPKSMSNQKHGVENNDSKTNNIHDFNLFSNQKAKLHDSFLGTGEYEKLVLPNGNFGLGFKRVCSKDGSLIGFGHAGLGGSTAYCDISNRFAICVTLNKLSFGSVTKDIIQFVCSELNVPIPEDYANLGLTPIN
ncbi:protein kinase-like domain, Beta-lactamase/transpeptidase-like protein [Artemisia annua]|uniref:Protein kinase-like domain, Beta-lactamase/transpeptidase-like protein n=1 Tax=Artemisia annua TaxID=35608 RepID=A0A2U1MD97_ARTAN|nr:protein kinase-like domain, Beta-lactamase/transpeptidase-like protein [Artemisia annua]